MRVRELQVEWREAKTEGVLDDAGHLGLERRAYRLLNGDDEAWLRCCLLYTSPSPRDVP